MMCLKMKFQTLKLVIEMQSQTCEIDSDIISKWKFKNINKISDTFFIRLEDNTFFSCHENFWIPFTREYKIDEVLK